MNHNGSNPAPAGTTGAAGSTALATPRGTPPPRVVPIPPPEPDGTKYLVGLVLTLVVSLVAIVVAHLMGGSLVPDRFAEETADGGGAEGDVEQRHLVIRSRNPNPPQPEVRAMDFSRIGRDDSPLDPDYLREVRDRIRNTRANRVPPGISAAVGDPVTIVEEWLQTLKDEEFIERYDQLGDVTATGDNGRIERVLYYSANAFIGHRRDQMRRELYRFVFVSLDELARGMRDQLDAMAEQKAPEADQQRLREQLDQFAAQSSSSDYYLMDYGRVRPSDEAYARYMTR